MKFVISYPQTNWDYAKFRFDRIVKGKDRSNEVFKGEPGGKLQLLEHQGELGKIKMLEEVYPTKPFGMEYVEGEGLYFICGLPCAVDGVAGDEHIARLNDNGEIDLEIRSPLFSQLRSLRRTEKGLLVTASGIDTILEVNFKGEVIWSWWATESGYPNAYGGGVRNLDKQMDHRLKCYSGKLQTTHMNSAIIDPYDDSKILTILFYQGLMARIDRKTLQHEIVIRDLNGAHHIRKHSRGYMLSNSRKGEVLIFDNSFNLIDHIQGTNSLFPIKWVQDAFEMPEGQSHLIADCNTFNLRERDINGKEKKFNTKMPNRIFQIEPVADNFSFKAFKNIVSS
ncbi:MAG: RHS repeat protein [Methylococcaceae bacterium]|nr:RHS repeat protein [Methylococcaceae bacterium]